MQVLSALDLSENILKQLGMEVAYLICLKKTVPSSSIKGAIDLKFTISLTVKTSSDLPVQINLYYMRPGIETFTAPRKNRSSLTSR